MPAHTKPWFRSCDLHTQSFMQASSAISFRLPPDSISAAASSGSPLLSSQSCDLISGFSGLSIPRFSPLPFHFLTPAVFAFFRPLQFWVLTTQPLFLPFLSSLFRLTAASQVLPSGFPSRSSTFRSAWFPVLHFLLPVLGFPVCFLSPFPDSLPQLFLRCLLSHFPLPFRFLSSSSVSLPATQRDCSSFLLSSRFRLQRLSGAPGFFRPSGLSPSFPIRFPTVPSGSAYSAFCWFPFVLPCFTPAAVRQVLTSRSHSRCFSMTFAFFRPLPF